MLDERPSDAVGRATRALGTPARDVNGAAGRALEAMVARLDDLERRLAEIEAADAERRAQS